MPPSGGCPKRPRSDRGCQECIELGDTWVHLRFCVECGKIGCCEDSKNTHAVKHARAHAHPVIRSAEPGEWWAWCYEDEVGARVTPQA
ncbi:MAG: UBP-type zinc finger domain-containing protein [Thermoleophilia bacterium]|nr:UBP-type zinc finger domain-containing protein [Thermoleophilia bacterium]